MAKQIPDLNEMLKNFVGSGDYLLIRDTSQREDKRILITELADALFLLQHNVGSVYITYSSTDDPNSRGGTWVLSSKGRSLIGVDSADSDFNSSGKTGGEKSHVLTTAEMPAHRHSKGHVNFSAGPGPANPNSSWACILQNSGWGVNMPDYVDSNDTGYPSTGSRGGSQAHNNLHPYETAYIWRRTE